MPVGLVLTVVLALASVGAFVVVGPVLTLAMLVIVGIAFVTIIKPTAAVLAVAAIVYSNAAALAVTFYGAPSIVAAAVPLLLVAPGLYYLGLQFRPLIIPPAATWLLALFTIQIVSTLLAADQWSAVGFLFTFILEGLVVFFLVTNAIRERRMLYLTLWVLLLTGAALGAISGFQQVTQTYYTAYLGFGQIGDGVVPLSATLGAELKPRLAGPIGESNYYAQYMLMLVPLGIVLIRIERRPVMKLLALGATALVITAMATAASRGGFLGLVIVLMVLTLLGYIRPGQLLVGGLVALVALSAISPGYINRLIRLQDVASGTEDADTAVLGRIGENTAALLAFSDHPIIGVGPGQFRNVYQDYARKLGADIHEGARVAHSLYLSTLAELGIVGAFAFFGAIATTMWGLVRWRSRLRAREPELVDMASAMFVSLIGFLATGIFLDLAYARYFWFMLAVAAAAGHLVSRAMRDEAEGEVSTPSLTVTPVAAASAGPAG
ncbi:MAG: O-antigen ligase family protein [Chloroflexota bacterium]